MDGMKNKYGPWVSGEEFFDRDIEIQRLTTLINEGNNILIVAPRRVGKTSLVCETFRRMAPKEADYFLYVDLQHCTTPEDVITAILMETIPYRALHDKVLNVFKAFWKQVQDNIESVGSSGLFEIKIREGLKGDWLPKGKEIMENLAQSDRPVAICLDELPVMLTRLLGSKKASEYELRRKDADVFLSWLRSIMGKHQEKLRFIVCGSIGLEPILRHHGLSHTISQLRPFHLDPWDKETAKSCLKALSAYNNVSLSDQLCERMLDHLGIFIPHHVQMFFGHLHEDCVKRCAKDITVDDIDRVYNNSLLSTRGHAELTDYEERLLRVLESDAVPLALDLLTETAVNNSLTIEAARLLAQRNLSVSAEDVMREVMEILQHDGYLEWNETKNQWMFTSYLIRDWWKRRFQQSYIELPKGR
jgi:uncharacterized protein